jgi:transketolase
MFIIHEGKRVEVSIQSYSKETTKVRVMSLDCSKISDDLNYPDKSNVLLSEVFCSVEDAAGVAYRLEKTKEFWT